VSADHMTILCLKICWYSTRIVGVIWRCNRGPVFKRHNVYPDSLLCLYASSL